MALASKTRLQIIELLAQQPMNIINLRKKLGVSSAMISKHVKQMEEAGILECETLPGERGNQKICKLALSELTLAFNPLPEIEQYEEHVIPVGSFVDYTVKPPCGLASSERYIGFLDDTRSFSLPDRSEASLVWFNSGYVMYRIPCFIPQTFKVNRIEISLEICSETTLYNEEYPSDITFELNGLFVGMWTSPGDLGKTRGIFNPAWWSDKDTQHGLLKTLTINDRGSYIDGILQSGTTAEQVMAIKQNDISLRIANYDSANNVGGINLFGKYFGNYKQDIDVRICYQK